MPDDTTRVLCADLLPSSPCLVDDDSVGQSCRHKGSAIRELGETAVPVEGYEGQRVSEETEEEGQMTREKKTMSAFAALPSFSELHIVCPVFPVRHGGQPRRLASTKTKVHGMSNVQQPCAQRQKKQVGDDKMSDLTYPANQANCKVWTSCRSLSPSGKLAEGGGAIAYVVFQYYIKFSPETYEGYRISKGWLFIVG